MSRRDRGEGGEKKTGAAGAVKASETRPSQERYEPEAAAVQARESDISTVAEPVPAEGGRVALVIDDLGRSVDDLNTLRDLDIPISYAVLPFEEQTPQVVSELRQRGVEILLHLPMEPSGAKDPGPGALRRPGSQTRTTSDQARGRTDGGHVHGRDERVLGGVDRGSDLVPVAASGHGSVRTR